MDSGTFDSEFPAAEAVARNYLMGRLRVDGECWIWTGPVDKDGYGKPARPHHRVGRSAHRLAWVLANGQTPPTGMCVLHSCDVRACARPSHLRLGTHDENMHDMVVRGRSPVQRGARNTNSKLSEAQVESIRAAAAAGETQAAIARRFGTTQPNVSMIVTRYRRAA
jgi:hypothetical protein